MNWRETLRPLASSCIVFLATCPMSVACRTTQPIAVQVDDAWITAKVKSKLASDPQVSMLDVSVQTEEGVVTLTGRVDDETARREAVALAHDTEGVVRVRDLISVGAMAQPAQAPHEDASGGSHDRAI